MRRMMLMVLLLGCRKEHEAVRSDPAATPTKRVACTIPDTDPIVTAVEVPARCDLSVPKTRHVGRGGSLTIGAGARLSFVKGAGLVVEGGALVARGTKEEPVTFGSVSQQPAPGDWSGLRFSWAPAPHPAPSASASAAPSAASSAAPSALGPAPGPLVSSLEHFVVEYAGDALESDPAAILVATREPKTIHLAHGRIRKNAGSGLRVYGSGALDAPDDIVFADSAAFSVDAPIADVALFGTSSFDRPVRVSGTVQGIVTLPKAPSYVFRHVTVHSPKTPSSLTIPEGSTVMFERGAGIDVGFVFGGTPGSCALVANKVTFTSAQKPPAAGDWISIAIHDACSANLDDAIIEYGGHTDSKTPRGALEVPVDDKSISIHRVTFKNLAGPAFTVEGSCKAWTDPAKANVFAGGKLCEEVPSVFGGLGILGALGTSGSMGSIFASDGGGIGFGSGSELGADFGSGGLGLSGVGGLGGGGGLGTIGSGGSGVSGGGNLGTLGGGGYGSKPSASVKEVSVTTTGKLPVEVVRRILRANIARLRACFGSSTKGGTIAVKIDIDATGKVSKVTSAGGTLTDAAIVSCVTSALSSVAFPEPESGTVVANATWDFQPP